MTVCHPGKSTGCSTFLLWLSVRNSTEAGTRRLHFYQHDAVCGSDFHSRTRWAVDPGLWRVNKLRADVTQCRKSLGLVDEGSYSKDNVFNSNSFGVKSWDSVLPPTPASNLKGLQCFPPVTDVHSFLLMIDQWSIIWLIYRSSFWFIVFVFSPVVFFTSSRVNTWIHGDSQLSVKQAVESK